MADIIGQVKASCLASLEHSGIAFDDAGQRAFLEQLDEADWKKHFEEHGAKFPLQYSSILEELNFLSIHTLLNFLSAYRVTLHKRTGKGAYDTIRRFMMGCFLQAGGDGESPLSAKGMAGLSESAVSDMLDLPILTEKDHQTLPVKIGERDPEAVEIVGLVLKAMNETGAILLQKGHADLGSFVADMLRKAEAQTSAERTNTLVQALVTTFPAFADEGTVKGHPVKVYKKAQLLAFIVATEFSDRGTSAPFPLPDASVVPACVDNVLPTMAVHFKLIDVSRSAYPVFSNGLGAPAASSDQKAAGLRLSHEEAYAIRAATLAACERVVSLTGEIHDKTGKEWLRSMTAMNLDGYLWQKAKDGELRNLPRLSEPNTYFY